MPRHAVGITLTRPVTPAELARASRIMPLAANHDMTHLMAVLKAGNPDQALNRARRRVKELLPVGSLTTHYPDQEGQGLLSVAFSTAADTAGFIHQ